MTCVASDKSDTLLPETAGGGGGTNMRGGVPPAAGRSNLESTAVHSLFRSAHRGTFTAKVVVYERALHPGTALYCSMHNKEAMPCVHPAAVVICKHVMIGFQVLRWSILVAERE